MKPKNYLLSLVLGLFSSLGAQATIHEAGDNWGYFLDFFDKYVNKR